MDASVDQKVFKVYNQPAAVNLSRVNLFISTDSQIHHQIDSLVPSYSCPKANAIRSQYQSVPAWTDHLNENADLKARLDATLGTAGLSAWSDWCKFYHTLLAISSDSDGFVDDHFFDTFASRTCNGHPLPCNSTGACVSQEDASRVFAIGDFEYK